MTSHRPVIVGTGIAGLWTAWRLAAEGRPARLVTKETLADSASAWAQGGIAVALGPGDNPGQHAADTLAAGDGLSDPAAVQVLTNEGPDRVRELLAMGATFDRGPDGRLRFGLEAAHTRARIIHAGGDRTGAALIALLTRIVADDLLVEILEHTEAQALIVDAGRVTGALLIQPGRPAFAVHAPADHQSLAIPAGGSTTTPSLCYGVLYPSIRFFAKSTSGESGYISVRVKVRSVLGLLTVLDGGRLTVGPDWSPTEAHLQLGAALASFVGAKSMQVELVPSTGVQIDDFYVDPLLSKR